MAWIKHISIVALVVPLLAGCGWLGGASGPRASMGAAGAGCQAGAASFAEAQIADDNLARRAQAAAGAQRTRVLRRGQTATPEVDPDRLTLEVGDFDRVVRAYCG